MAQALSQARQGRLEILRKMAEVISEPRCDLSPHAPRAASLRIEPNRIGALVGSGGKTIKGLQSELKVTIDVDQGGTVRIYANGIEAMRKAQARVSELAGIARLGETYEAQVVGVQPFGSFVRLFEGIEGLLPSVSLQPNSRVKVKVTGVNERGRMVLELA
jgi:polyribonucleotide nucleotidyltransferase